MMKLTKSGTILIIPLAAMMLHGCGTTVVNPPGPGKVVVKPGAGAILVKPRGHRHGGKWHRKCHRHGGLGRHCH